MTKIANVLGDKYETKRRDIFTRQFELGGHTFKVRIPFVAESDAIYKKIMSPDEEYITELYIKMAEPLLKFKDEPNEGLEFKDDDVLVGGRSIREAAKNKAMTEAKITEYIKLLIPENPQNNLDDITFADIEAEFPTPIQLSLIEKIGEVISPTYKETRGN